MNRKIRDIVLIILAVVALVAAIVVSGPSTKSAQADAWPYYAVVCNIKIYQPYKVTAGADYIRGKGTVWCDSTKVSEQRILTRLQQKSGTGWVNVPDTGSGAKYTGPGSAWFPATSTTVPHYCFGSRDGVFRIRMTHTYKTVRGWAQSHFHWGPAKTIAC